MSVQEIFLTIAALVPAIVLLVYIYIKDRAEKEPIGLLLLLFGLGVVVCFPTVLFEDVFCNINDSIFSNFSVVEGDTTYMPTVAYYLYHLINNFVCVALVEEGLKWIVMFFVTRKNKNFNSLFDGIVYAVFVSLGFAAFENVLYVLQSGWYVAALRFVTSVPGHMFFGVIMGYFYTMWNITHKAGQVEISLVQKSIISTCEIGGEAKGLLVRSILFPILLHGFYDFCLSLSSWISTVVFYIFLIILYVFCFKKIRYISKNDYNAEGLVTALVYTRHLLPIENAAKNTSGQNNVQQQTTNYKQ